MNNTESYSVRRIIELAENLFIRYLDYIKVQHSYIFFGDGRERQREDLERIESEIVALVPSTTEVDSETSPVSIISAILEKAFSEWRTVQGKIDSGSHLTQSEYERLMESQFNLLRSIKRVERAMLQATSDLDALTGLHNRQAMNRDLEREQSRAQRTGKPFAVALADLDRFKAINDQHGHKAGDIVLATAAEVFLNAIRPYDIVYRYGGEEFLIYLHDASATVAVAILNRLLDKLRATSINIGNGVEITVTSSFGVCEGGVDLSLMEIIDRADKALYQAKASGRSQVCLYSEYVARKAKER
jgi:diguanylate cyclase (GGDEF)-like protein